MSQPKRKAKTPRQRFIAAQKRKGLTEGEALYRWRLKSGLKSGRTVRESRGHTLTEKPAKRQRSKVAKELGYDTSRLRSFTKRPKNPGPQQGATQKVFVFSHLTRTSKEKHFAREVAPYAAKRDRALRRKDGLLSFRFVYTGPYGPYTGDPDRIGSTAWAIYQGDNFSAQFYAIHKTASVMACYLSEFV